MSFTAQITANVDGFSRGIDQATKEIDRLQKTVEERLAGIGKSMESIGKRASILSVALVAAGGKAFSMASDFEDAMGATDQVFKDASQAVKDWADGLPSQYGVAKKEALEYSNMMGTMLTNIGKLSEEQASKTSSKLVELAGDLTAMYGGQVSEAVNALTGALRGNNVMLTRYGIAINDTMIKARALELGLTKQGQEMSLTAKQAATLSLIYEQSSAAQGQAAREADSASGSMRALKTEITNLSTEIGEVLLPIITPVISRLRDVVAAIRTMSPEMLSLSVGIAGVAAAAGPVLVVIGKLLQMLPAIKVAIAALTGPVGLVVAAIAGAAALIITNWDKIKAYFTTGGGAEMFNTLKSMAIDIKNEVVGAFNMIKDAVTYIWNAIGDDIIKIFGNALNTVMTALETLVKTFRNVAQILHGIFTLDFKFALDGLKNLFVDLFNGISRIVLNTVSTISSTLAGLFDLVGLDKWANGLRSFSDKLTTAVSAITSTTEEATQAVEEQEKAVKKLNNTVTGLGDAVDSFKDGSDIYALVRRTSDEITVLNQRLEGLRNGTIAVQNVKKEIEETEKKVQDLSKTLDLLTGNRDLNINLKVNGGLQAWNTSDMFKDINPVITPTIDTSLVKNAMGDLSAGIQVITLDIQNMLTSGIADLMGAVSDAIVNGDNVMQSLGASMLGTVGKIMVDLGKLAIGIGIGLEGIKKAFQSLNPIAAIAAGTALIALGSMFTAASRKMGNSIGGSSGNYSGGTSSYNNVTSPGSSEYRGAYTDDFVVTFVQRGDDLVGVLDTAQQRRKRL